MPEPAATWLPRASSVPTRAAPIFTLQVKSSHGRSNCRETRAVDERNGRPVSASLSRRVLAEFLGTLLLLTAVIGSGIMGERLAQGNAAVALLANTMATVFALFVLIEVLAPVSGAHFNPVVTLVFARPAGL